MAISNELRKLVDPNNECCCEHCLSNKMKSCIPEEVILILWKNKFGWGVRMDTPENETFYQDGIFKTEFEAVTKAYKWIMENTKCGS